MTKEELNIWIAEKLMGLEYVSAEDDIENTEHWTLDGVDTLFMSVPNYFAEGWEQVKKEVVELGLEVREKASKSGDSIIYDVMFESVEDDILIVHGWIDAEQARYLTMKQAQPEIERRLNERSKRLGTKGTNLKSCLHYS